MRVLTPFLALAIVANAQQHFVTEVPCGGTSGINCSPAGGNRVRIPVLVHDWQIMPNIVHNIINAASGVGYVGGPARTPAPGLLFVHFSDNTVHPPTDPFVTGPFSTPLTKSGTAGQNRGGACPSSYCAKLFLQGTGRKSSNPPPIGRASTFSLGGFNGATGGRDNVLFGYNYNPTLSGRFDYATGQNYPINCPALPQFGINQPYAGDATCVPYPKNRKDSSPGAFPGTPLPWFLNCDEYPFAASANGGRDARVNCVPDIEQDIQARVTGDFYNGNSAGTFAGPSWLTAFPHAPCNIPGMQYYVAVINVPRRMFDFIANPDPRFGAGIPDFCLSNNPSYRVPNPVSSSNPLTADPWKREVIRQLTTDVACVQV